jgi:hypothetical protein
LTNNLPEIAARNAELLEQYRAHKPYRDKGEPPVDDQSTKPK